MKKVYRIRKNSPMDYIMRALPLIGIIAVMVAAGLMNSYELGIL